jgi:CBS domain-containing protein
MKGRLASNHQHLDTNMSDQNMTCCSEVMKPIEASSCCTPMETAAHAARAIRDSACGCAPVVQDSKNLKLVGVITEHDVCCGTAALDRRASEVRVQEIMRPATACCETNESVASARQKLHTHRTTSLPVVDKSGGCCGTVSIHHLEMS